MTYIHKTATLIGEMQFQNGYKNQLWISYNHNTSAPIVWQRVFSVKTQKWSAFKRSTGKNIVAIQKEMADLFQKNIATWSIAPKETILQAFLAAH